jgi:dihydroorotate dehydrogenase (fumarate)
MADLATTYMGINLRNPLIVASSSLVKSLDDIKQAEANGAGAVVLKSLFEEQIFPETDDLNQQSDTGWHSESFDYIYETKMDMGEREYLALISNAKKTVSIPVFASINCHSLKGWMEYAHKLENAGADGLELNISLMQGDPDKSGKANEEHYLKIIKEVKKHVHVPIAVKVGPYFSSMAKMAAELALRGASALVLFNRFYQFDIDIDHLKITGGNQYSTSSEIHIPLRWIALLAGKIQCDLAASTGIHTSIDVIKFILAGASVIQLCSVLYQQGFQHIRKLLDETNQWMDDHDFNSLDLIRGMLSQAKSEQPEGYERLQYVKALVGIE